MDLIEKNFRAECTCGWTSDRTTKIRAEIEATIHDSGCDGDDTQVTGVRVMAHA